MVCSLRGARHTFYRPSPRCMSGKTRCLRVRPSRRLSSSDRGGQGISFASPMPNKEGRRPETPFRPTPGAGKTAEVAVGLRWVEVPPRCSLTAALSIGWGADVLSSGLGRGPGGPVVVARGVGGPATPCPGRRARDPRPVSPVSRGPFWGGRRWAAARVGCPRQCDPHVERAGAAGSCPARS